MKNACKRLFSLMLALVLLVSVVPFQAMAAEAGTGIKVKFKTLDGDDISSYDWKKQDEKPNWSNIEIPNGYENGEGAYLENENPEVGYQGKIWYIFYVSEKEEPKTEIRVKFKTLDGEDISSYKWKNEDVMPNWSNIEIPDGYENSKGAYLENENPEVGYQGKIWYVFYVAEKVTAPTQKFYAKFKTAEGNDKSYELRKDEKPSDNKINNWLSEDYKGYEAQYEGRKEWEGDIYYVYNLTKINRYVDVYVKVFYNDKMYTTGEPYSVKKENIEKFNNEWIKDAFKQYNTDKHSVESNTLTEKQGKYVWEVELEDKLTNNVVVTFKYKDEKVGDRIYKRVKNPDDYIDRNDFTRAESLMKEAGISSKTYELKLNKDGRHDYLVISHREDDGVHYYTIILDKKSNNKTIELTVYIDGNTKPVVNQKKITVDADETFKNDHEDWLRKAMGDKYNPYDYDVKDYKVNDNKTAYKVWLTSRKSSNQSKYAIYLDIYTNGNTNKPAKSVKITKGAAKDGKVTLSEAKSVVREYFIAKNDDGIDFEGLWKDENKFHSSGRKDTIYVDEYLENEESLYIAIKADNVKAKPATNNPKTGDTIFAAVTVMTLSLSTLAAVFFVHKKRAVK